MDICHSNDTARNVRVLPETKPFISELMEGERTHVSPIVSFKWYSYGVRITWLERG